jgi:hypothetical protein
MKLHSNTIDYAAVIAAMNTAKDAGRISQDVFFVKLDHAGSRSRRNAFDIQLGTYDKTTGPTKSRKYKNSGTSGADSIWSATYSEWGWFIAELFAIDPEATFGPYKGVADFNEQTSCMFVNVADQDTTDNGSDDFFVFATEDGVYVPPKTAK